MNERSFLTSREQEICLKYAVFNEKALKEFYETN